jgi:hypothetical protein
MHRLKTVSILLAAALSGALLSGCQRNQAPPAASGGGMSPDAHKALVAAHDWPDAPAFADATKGLIAAPKGQIKAEDGSVAWDFDSFAFVKGDAPLTAHPGLWRQAKLNNQIGLFKVTEGIWQLRGFDLANISLIQGKTGWIVIDPLTSRETAAYAMAFARQHLGDKPVSAIIYTHSHVDHFGGALGIISAEDAAARKLPIVAPAGFMEEATSETIIAGTAHGPAGDVPVRARPAAQPRGHDRRRPGQDHVLRPHRHPAADPGGGAAAPGAHHRRRALRLPQRAGQRGTLGVHLRDPGPQGLLRRRDADPHAAQRDDARAAPRCATRCTGRVTCKRRSST